MLKPRASIFGLNPYRSPIGNRGGISLDLNESQVGCSPRVLERLHSLSAEEVSFYPQREVGENLVADFLRLAPDQVLLTNGMDEALALLFTTYLGLDSNDDQSGQLLFADPTFVMYPALGEALGASIVRLQSGTDLALPVSDVLARISSRTRVIVIANPNNPTGLAAARADLLKIAAAAPHAAVVIDEAYVDFCDQTVIANLDAHPNLFVLRTFSKAYGLAGLRLGVIAASAEQVGYLRRFALPFNVNSTALACLESALSDQEFVRDHVAQVKRQRDRLSQLFSDLGLYYWPSQTNFVLVRVGSRLKEIIESLQHRGVMVRDTSSNPGCEGCVRITVGTPEQMDAVLPAIRETFAQIQHSHEV